MEILKQINGEEVLLTIIGRIDTVTSPELGTTLESLYEGCKSLIFDLEKVDYVSSAGLRVFLSAQKKMNNQGKMVLRNVCEEVMEVFEMTGFVNFLTIE